MLIEILAPMLPIGIYVIFGITVKNMNLNLRNWLFFIRRKNLTLFLFIILVFVVILGYQLLKYPTELLPQDEKIVEIDVLKRSSIRQTVDVIGTIKSRKKTVLTAKSKGVLKILSKPGQLIEKGDLLAKINNDDIEKNYEILKEAEEIAKIQFDRAYSLLKSGTLSTNAVEEKKSILLDIQKKLSDARIILEDLKIYAPFDGIVGLFKFREGSEVGVGDAITTFYDPKSLLVEFDLPLSVAKQVNDEALIFVNSKEYRLTHVQKMLDEETHMCPAYAEISCTDCIVGTAVDVSVVIKEKTDVIVIPFEAVFLRNERPFIYTIKENKAILTSVELGIQDKKQVEIKSGLKEGDQIIVYGHNRLYPDALVKIHTQSES